MLRERYSVDSWVTTKCHILATNPQEKTPTFGGSWALGFIQISLFYDHDDVHRAGTADHAMLNHTTVPGFPHFEFARIEWMK